MTKPIDPEARAARIAEIFKRFFPGGEIGSFVNGEILIGSGAELDLTDPASGRVFATFKDADRSAIDSAMDAAARARHE